MQIFNIKNMASRTAEFKLVMIVNEDPRGEEIFQNSWWKTAANGWIVLLVTGELEEAAGAAEAAGTAGTAEAEDTAEDSEGSEDSEEVEAAEEAEEAQAEETKEAEDAEAAEEPEEATISWETKVSECNDNEFLVNIDKKHLVAYSCLSTLQLLDIAVNI